MGLVNRRTGLSVAKFLKATIAGGLLFLLPMVIVVVVLQHAMRLAGKVTQPISNLLPMSAGYGVAVVSALAVLALVLISLGAGLVARTGSGKRIKQWIEDSYLGHIPLYQHMKIMGEGLAQIENGEGVTPVLVSIEDGWQIGYLIEPLGNGWVTVFLPQAPTPMSGNVMYFPENRIRPLGITMGQAIGIVKRLGVGSGGALQGVSLELTAGA